MVDLSSVNMEGVKPMGDGQELPAGQYLVRIEDTDRIATKDKFDEAGNKMPQGFYLQVKQHVYGGEFEGHDEIARLNLWNSNKTAVDMGAAELKSIGLAIGIDITFDPASKNCIFVIDGARVPANTDLMHNRWMILEVTAGKKDPTKTYKKYLPVDPSILSAFSHIPLVPAKAPSPAATPAATQHAQATPSPAPVTQSKADDLPDWAKPKK